MNKHVSLLHCSVRCEEIQALKLCHQAGLLRSVSLQNASKINIMRHPRLPYRQPSLVYRHLGLYYRYKTRHVLYIARHACAADTKPDTQAYTTETQDRSIGTQACLIDNWACPKDS